MSRTHKDEGGYKFDRSRRGAAWWRRKFNKERRHRANQMVRVEHDPPRERRFFWYWFL